MRMFQFPRLVSAPLSNLCARLGTAESQTTETGQEEAQEEHSGIQLGFRYEPRNYWKSVEWSNELAIRRYVLLLESVERSASNPGKRLLLEEFEIPWPVLHRPLSYLIQDIAPEWVAAFFMALRNEPEYHEAYVQTLIRRSMKVFYEDTIVAHLAFTKEEDKALVRRVSRVVWLELSRQWKV